jgi:hypothetical protein
MKAILFIAALVISILPSGASANLILNQGFESSTSSWTFSSIGLPDDHDQAKVGRFWLGGNIGGCLTFKTIWVPLGSLSGFQLTFDTAGDPRPNMGWTAATTTLSLASQPNTAYGSAIEPVQTENTPEPIPPSIILFAPGLAGILVRRNWPQKLSLRTLKRSFFELIHHVSGFSVHGNLLRKILLRKGFFAYFQFIHFQLRTIQLNQ